MTRQHLHAQPGVTLHAVVRRNRANHCFNPLHHSLEADPGRAGCHAIVGGMPDLMGQCGTADQRFGRHAAIVEAVASHFVRFDQRHLCLDRCRNISRHQAARARANHDQITVKTRRALRLPAGINAAALEKLHQALDAPWQHAQQHKRTDESRRRDRPERVNPGQLRARIHKHHRAREHAQHAYPKVGQGFDARQPHQQIQGKKRHRRNQPQREQVKSAFFFKPLVDGRQPVAKARLNCVPQHVTRSQHRQRCPDGRRQRHHHRAHHQPKTGAGGQRHQRCSRQ